MSLKALAFGDLHYPREHTLFFKLLRLIKRMKPNVIIICNDIINYGNIGYLDKVLNRIRRVSNALYH